jgi:hypothetical protein
MKTINSSADTESQLSPTMLRNPELMRVVRTLSWAVSLIFLIALIWAVYQAVVNGNPLPAWAWLGVVVLFAVAVGMAVAVLVYWGAAGRAGSFDFSPSGHVTGELRSQARRVEADGASSLRAEIRMMEGVLQLMGGTADVMDAIFTYDDADWKPPLVEYAVDAAGLGNLMVKQRATHRPAMGQGRCEWVIHLNQDLPTDLEIQFGAGKADLRLAGLALNRLRVESGVGELILDLSGEWKHSMQAIIKAGIGDTLLRLPQNAGVDVQSTVGLGSVHRHGLAWDGQAYTNALYGQSAVTLDIIVEGGMGKINLEQTG